ncbi:NAD-dependent epimerase/dehydratase family protein [bacterium]|nr:NAD-dependent epimerase/dehydratase family protein [bacterium]
MKKIIITGVAGFIGSSLAERMIRDGFDVTGIDCFTAYYSPRIKQANIRNLLTSKKFRFIESDVTGLDDSVLDGVECFFHLAAQPGVRNSWGEEFREYVFNNIYATQYILEKLKSQKSLQRLVFASSSSVYGNSSEKLLTETLSLKPVSPYGITKLTAENLCTLYRDMFGVPCVSLRFFTVYGPRQRPDMAFHRFLRACLMRNEINVFGDGSQTRDFTYIDDIVSAILSAGFSTDSSIPGIINLGSGKRIVLNEALDMISEITGEKLRINHLPNEKGDMTDTLADISLAGKALGYSPSYSLYDGLKAEYEWMCKNRDVLFS